MERFATGGFDNDDACSSHHVGICVEAELHSWYDWIPACAGMT
jgi:hypothetical protein